MTTLLFIHAAATWTLVGLIWTVQLAIYPLFATIPAASFSAYHARYTRAIGYVVAPLMLVELGTGIAWLTLAPKTRAAWVGLGLIGAMWLITAFVQVPQHRRLSLGHDPALIRHLTRGNWLRTAAWTARGLLVTAALSATLPTV
jgi:hypothetical protein